MNIVFEKDPKIKVASFEDLLEPPVVLRVGDEINDALVKAVEEEMRRAHLTGQAVIPVMIHSFGGCVYSLLALTQILRSARKPVLTCVNGAAFSAAAILASYGTPGYRCASRQATFMIHEVSSGYFGKLHELESNAEETRRLNTLLFQEMAKNCGKSETYFLEQIHERNHADWFLTPEEALQHGIIDKIGIPCLKLRVAISSSVEWEEAQL